jgi:tRNA nucleotidyltransferase (CCA-adding enzyme)
MKYIKSCGFVAYKHINNENFYLIIKSINGDVGFPKGHMEKDETELQTAIRELKEETGVTVDYVPNFREQIEYKLPKTNNVMKQSIYFLGNCTSDNIVCQETEVSEAKFVSYENALEILTFDETKSILKNAELFIRNIHRSISP